MKMRNGLFLTIFALLLIVVVGAAHAESVEPPDEHTIYVTDYGAVPGDGVDDHAAINAALEDARTGDGTMTVVIPAGDWDIGGILYVFSNTVLKAESGATLRSSIQDGPVLAEAHIDPATGDICRGACQGHSFGYTKAENITIAGGTWIADPAATGETQIFAFHHSKNITVRNLTCKNMSGHAVNLGGVDHATVSGVTITNQRPDPKKTGRGIFTSECVHLDYCTAEGEPWFGMPYDNTPTRNVTVTNCVFRNVYSGVGNHHEIPAGGTASSNITVRNCTFTDLKAYATSVNGMRGMKVTGCTATETPVLAFLIDITQLEIRNNTVDAGSHAYSIFDGEEASTCTEIYLYDCSDVTVTENTIRNFLYNAVKINFSASAEGESEISGNTIESVSGTGLNVRNGKNRVTVSGNNLSGIGDAGIFIGSLADAVVSGNTVDSSAGMALYVIGNKSNPASVAVTENILSTSSAEGYDLYLHHYTDCVITGNTLKNYSFHAADGAEYTADFPPMETVELDQDSYEYTGEEIFPVVTVKDAAGRILTEGTDYKLVYSHNIRAGDPDALVRVKGITYGMFEGQTVDKKFTIIPKAVKPKVKLDQTSYVYDGKTKKPAVKVTLDGKKVPKNDYSVTYSKGRKTVGTYTVTVAMRKNFSGTKEVSFTIVPAAVKSPSVTAGKKKLTVGWEYDKKNDYDGYEIEYSLKKKFNGGVKTITVKEPKTTSAVLKGLKKGKTYYIRIRAWKKVDGEMYYSEWSETLKKKTE